MLKKIALSVASTLIIGHAFAANSGFYVGGNVGRDTGAIKSNEAYSISGISSSNYTYKSHLSDYVVGLYTGYDAFFTQHFVIGGEVFANRSNSKASWNSNLASQQREFQKLSTIGISLLPGWQIDNNNRLFARLGVVQSEFDHENNNPTLYGPSFHDKNSTGFESGLGWLASLTQHIALRLEYDHIDYNSIEQGYNSGTTTGKYVYKPQFDQYTLGMSYYFNPDNIATTSSAALRLINQGIYTGVAAARSDTNLNINTSESDNPNYAHALQGYAGDVHLGYRWAITPTFNLAAETFAMINSSRMDYNYFSSLSLSPPARSYTDTLREKESYGLSLLPGYDVTTSSRVYGRVGVIDSRFTKAGAYIGPEFNTTRTGLQLGVGYETAIANQWSILGEYDHADYAEIHTTSTTGTTVNYNPRDNLYKIGVNYAF